MTSIIPFTSPQDREVLNLLQIVRVHQVRPSTDETPGELEVFLTDGTKRVYTGEAADILLAECLGHQRIYRQAIAAINQAAHGGPLIVPADITGRVN